VNEEECYRIIKRPLVTEKTTLYKEAHNKVTFVVANEANKIQIKQAVERLFEVQVENVRTMNIRGKVKRLGVHQGKRPDWKKAIVTLKEGDRIDLFETV
jgi:large subunit ribosomal protein L23